jgi:hypothetical protein
MKQIILGNALALALAAVLVPQGSAPVEAAKKKKATNSSPSSSAPSSGLTSPMGFQQGIFNEATPRRKRARR